MASNEVIPAYPYIQYSDDINISAWFDAHNESAQSYLDWFNSTNLAIYTNDNISGDLLDWVANGIYGVYRTPIPTTSNRTVGPINTYTPNSLEIDQERTTTTSSVVLMTDDVLKRLITWNFFKGDGMQFTIPWVKKRVARFLYGINGFSDTNDISVSVPSTQKMNISVAVDEAHSGLAQQLSTLLKARIPNFPYGYDVSLVWVDSNMTNNDFGGDIV